MKSRPGTQLDELLKETIREFGNTLPTLIEAAETRGIELDFDQVRKLVPRDVSLPAIHTKHFIGEFIRSYLQQNPPKTILDPCVGLGETLSLLVKSFNPQIAIGVEINRETFDAARLLRKDLPISLFNANSITSLQEIILDVGVELFDVVIADPPWGVSFRHSETFVEGSKTKFKGYLHDAFMLKAAALLAENGVAFFVLPASIFFDRFKDKRFEALTAMGVNVEAAISLPAGTFSPASHLEGVLLIVTRVEYSDLFVAELVEDADYQKNLLKNLRQRKGGNALELGHLTDRRTFTTFDRLRSERELEDMFRAQRIPPTLLSALAKGIKSIAHGAEPSEKPNAIYIPTIGTSPTVTSIGEMKIKPHNYLEVVLDEGLANSTYTANFLNSPLGIRIRQSLFSGVHIPRITRQSLQYAQVCLPSLRIQNEIVSVNTSLSNLASEVEALKTELWTKPTKVEKIRSRVRKLNHEDSIVGWIDGLPFPLASILWTYHAAKESAKKVEHLLHFFEAFSQWTTTIMLSGLSQNLAFCNEAGVVLFDEDEQSNALLRSDFGGWNSLLSRLGKALRRLQADRERIVIARKLLGNPDEVFMAMLTDKAVFSILDKVRGHRNEWKGHGGVANAEEFRRRTLVLEDELSNLRKIVGDAYLNAILLSPVRAHYNKGIFNNVVKTLVGSKTIFVEKRSDTTIPLDTDYLYLQHHTDLEPLRLLPVVRMMESPRTQQNACYFFSRVNSDGVRWVSYHFEMDADITTPGERFRNEVLSLLETADVES